MKSEERGWKGSEDVARYQGQGFTLILRKVACGKANCNRCPHGPYWYYSFSHKGKARTVYVGKTWRNGGQLKSADVKGLLVAFGQKLGLKESAKGQASEIAAGEVS